MKKSIIKNYLYNLTYQILVLILPIITTPYISRVLGAENIGIYSYTLSISALFILFGSLGMALYGQREIAYNQDKPYEYSKIFWEILLLRLLTMSISILVYIFTFANYNQYAFFYRILLLELIANIFDISWFFQGLEDFKKTVKRSIVIRVLSIISIFIFIKSKNDLTWYYWIYVLSLVISNATLWMYLPKTLVKIRIRELNLIKHLKPTLILFIPKIAIEIYTVLDRTMIGTIIADKSEVGMYTQGQKIIKMLLQVVTSLGTVMLPRIASQFAKGKNDEIVEYLKKSFTMTFLTAIPMTFGILAVADEFVPLFFGEGYEKVSILMKVICPILIFIGTSNVTGVQYLLPTKRQKEYTISVFGGSVVNIILNAMFIPKYGAFGASIGTVIAELTVTSIQLYCVKGSIDIKCIFKISKNYIFSGIIMFLICELIGKCFTNTLISLIIQVSVGTAIYALCLYILKDEGLNIILRKLKERFKR